MVGGFELTCGPACLKAGLGKLPGGISSRARAINERGQIVGTAIDESWFSHGILWEPSF